MDKTQRQDIRNKLAEKEVVEFESGLPINKNVFLELFDYLDSQLAKKGCDHTTILTRTFLDKKRSF